MEAPSESSCRHCGDDLGKHPVIRENHAFCCAACAEVFALLTAHGLHGYYALPERSSNRPVGARYAWMDDSAHRSQVWKYLEKQKARAKWHLPGMHCASCIWLLDRLPDLHPGILSAEASLSARTIDVWVNPELISASELALLLSSIGYPPEPDTQSQQADAPKNNRLVLQLGVAGFSLGNIMLWSFPEYLGFKLEEDPMLYQSFQYLNLVFCLPLVGFSGIDYLKTAWLAIKNRLIHIDIPLALGMLVLFFRTAWDILSQSGPGYADSLAGLLFFLLLAKWYQARLFHSLRFDRDPSAYLPLSAIAVEDEKEIEKPVGQLTAQAHLRLFPGDLVPADGRLLGPMALLDYSFVTGENEAVQVEKGALVYAGARNAGQTFDLLLHQSPDQSYLRGLWNQGQQNLRKKQGQRLTNAIAGWFIAAILLVAFAGGLYWYFNGSGRWLEIVSSILIIACPCALALSAPFSTGNMARLLARRRFFVREPEMLEQLARCGDLVFDKTGTLTEGKTGQVSWEGKALDQEAQSILKALVKPSRHPVSQAIWRAMDSEVEAASLQKVMELPGKGMQGENEAGLWKLGQHAWVENGKSDPWRSGRTLFAGPNGILGGFHFENKYRPGVPSMLRKLAENYKVYVLSGDHEGEAERLKSWVGSKAQLMFRQQPEDKVQAIREIQAKGLGVCFLGDGLNDAPALKEAQTGIAVTGTVNGFFPACDAILEAGNLSELPELLRLSKFTVRVIRECFVLSLVYNSLGVSVALAGWLHPVMAAVLMPLSSLTVVFWAMSRTWWAEKKSRKSGWQPGNSKNP